MILYLVLAIKIDFLTESSAESEIYNSNKAYYDNSYYYSGEFSLENEAILLLPILMENKNIDEYYNAIFDSDINSFCNFFNAKTPDEIKDLYRIIYCLDSIVFRSDFEDKYFNDDTYTRGDLKNAIGYDYEIQIFKTTLQNLINYTENNNDFTLKENLILLYMIRDKIVYVAHQTEERIDNNGDTYYVHMFSRDFSNSIKYLNDKYIEYLCFKYNVTMGYIDSISFEIDKAIRDIQCYSYREFYECDNFEYTENFCNKFPLVVPFERNHLSTYDYRFWNELQEGKNIEYYDDKDKNLTYNKSK